MQRHELRQTGALALSQQMRLSLHLLHMDGDRLRRRLRYEVSVGAGLALSDLAEPAPSVSARQALLAQVGLLRLDADQARIARGLVHCLDDHGWLSDPLPEIAGWLGCPPAMIEALLPRLQTLEPAGVFARSLPEHLRLALQARNRYDPMIAALLERLDLAAAADLPGIAALCGCDTEDAADMLADLRGLAPCPLSDQPPLPPPELELDAQGGLHHLLHPELTLAEGADAQAQALAAAVSARNRTLWRVAQTMVRHQRGWLLGQGAQKPLTLAMLAPDLGLNKSTLSRAIAGVALRSPRGTLALRALLLAPISPRLAHLDRTAVLRLLDGLIRGWPDSEPISDARLAEALARRGMAISRRTVAKYRTLLACKTG